MALIIFALAVTLYQEPLLIRGASESPAMPPKRAERAAGSTDASTEVPESTETIEERHAHLITAEQAQPRLAEIEEMERELREGSSPTRLASADTSLAPENQ